MLVVNSAGDGTYPFFSEGGLVQVGVNASSWNSGSGSASVQWVDEAGNTHGVSAFNFTSDSAAQAYVPPGSYNLVVSGSVTGLTVAWVRIPT